MRFVFFRGAPAEGEGQAEAQTIIGHATLAANELRVETNSGERAATLRARLEQACGGLIAHRRQTQANPLAPRLVDEAAPKIERSPPAPAAVEAMRALKRQHYGGWADQPLPALAGKTPRDALRSSEDAPRSICS